MCAYTLSDLKNKSGKHDYRLLELPDNVTKKIWIPELTICYHRVHFHVKKDFPRAKYNVLDCPNQNMGENGEGCPICDLTKKLWNDWKIADGKKDKAKKLEIQNLINQIVSEEVFLNGIDIEDDDQMFQAIRFTRAQGLKILAKVEAEKKKEKNPISGIQDIIWYYTKSKSDKGKTDYELTNIDSPELAKLAKSLYAKLDELKAREYDEGGPIDLDKAIIRERSLKEFKALLEGGEVEEDVESNTSSTSKATETIDVDESESISLDDLNTEKDKEESLDMDSLELGEVELDVPVMKKLTPDSIKNNTKNAEFLKAAVAFALKSKWISDLGKLAENVKSLYKYIQEKKEVEIPETEFAGIPF